MSNTQQAAAGATISMQADGDGETEVNGFGLFSGLGGGISVTIPIVDHTPTNVLNGMLAVLNNGGYVVPK
jgi:hypothetical protein